MASFETILDNVWVQKRLLSHLVCPPLHTAGLYFIQLLQWPFWLNWLKCIRAELRIFILHLNILRDEKSASFCQFFSDDCLISLFKIQVLNYDIKIDPSLILGRVTILQLYVFVFVIKMCMSKSSWIFLVLIPLNVFLFHIVSYVLWHICDMQVQENPKLIEIFCCSFI